MRPARWSRPSCSSGGADGGSSGVLARDVREALTADLWWYGVSKPSLRHRLTEPIVCFHVALRRCEHRKRLASSPWGRARYFWSRWRLSRWEQALGFDVPLEVFGPGLSIPHMGTVVVNAGARVGSNCRLHPGVTIGATGAGAPVLGDDVFVGPGAGVFGAVTIGSRCHIGPGCVVTTSLPDDTLVVPAAVETRPLTRPTWQAQQREKRTSS